ncbi:MAG: TonB-dependent receptor [Paraglaciecola sp.]|uniref:TonB-dependent receptor plug domain-containing protein n=1 Tax=Paraglaciecola sp. TaxID=1920173 RepID=UPI00326690B6
MSTNTKKKLQLNILTPLYIAGSAALCNNISANEVEVFTVTGSHIQDSSLTEAVANISLSAADIAAMAPNNLADVLTGIPGIDISQQGGISGLTYLSIRGGDPNFVVILIDGVKVNDPTNSRGGAFDLGSIDPSVIEKVDIFYGSFSTVYGSDGLSGVLSITTKKSDQLAANAGVKVGEDITGGSIRVSSPIGESVNFNLNASLQDRDNSTFSEAFQRKQLTTTIRSNENLNTQWDVSAFYVDGEGQYFPEDSGADRLAEIRNPETRAYTQSNAAARIQHEFKNALNVSLHAAFSKRDEQLSSPGIAAGVLDSVPPIETTTKYKRTDINVTANYPLLDSLHAAIGVAASDEDGGMQSIIDFGFPLEANYSLNRQVESIFTELAFTPFAAINVMSGIRYDKTDNLSVTTKRLLANLSLDNNTRLSAQYSEGFKLSSFFALGHPLVGNPELQPERSENIELSLAHTLLKNRLSTSMSLYQNTYSNLVDFDPETFTNVNRSKVRVKGAEASGSFQASEAVKLTAQITYTDINTFEADVVLRRRPEYKGSVNVNYEITPTLNVAAKYTINGKYYDSSVPTGQLELDGYNQLDVSVYWAINQKTNVRLNIQNALNNDQEQTIGFNNLGSQASLRIYRGI